MEMKTRRSFSKQFKVNAVKMIVEEGMKVSETARELEITENTLHNWKRKYFEDQEEAFPGNGKLKSKDDYIRELELENKRLKDERDILKKAAIFFAKEE